MHEILLIEKLSDRGLSRLMFTLFTFFSSRFSRMWTLLGPKWRSKWFSAWVFVLRREFCCCFSEDGEEMYKVLKRTCWAIDLIFSFVFRPPRWSLLHQIESFPDIIAVIYRQPNALCLCIAKTTKTKKIAHTGATESFLKAELYINSDRRWPVPRSNGDLDAIWQTPSYHSWGQIPDPSTPKPITTQ